MNEEYKMLREEIMFRSKQMYLYFAFTVPAVSTVLVYIFNNIEKPNSNSIFIALFVLLICATTRVKKLISNIVCISAYMEVFLESNIDVRNWETRCNCKVNGYTSQELDKRNPLINIMVFKTISTWFLLGTITYILYIIILFVKNNGDIFRSIKSFPENFVFIFNTFIFIILMYIILSKRGTNRDIYIEHWKEAKKKEKESGKLGNAKMI